MCSFRKEAEMPISASTAIRILARRSEAYGGIVEYVRISRDERSMTQAVIGTVSEMDAPMNPAAKALRAQHYLTGQTAAAAEERIRFWMRRRRISGAAGHTEGISGRRLPVLSAENEEDRRGKRTFGTLEQLLFTRLPDKSSVLPMDNIHNGEG